VEEVEQEKNRGRGRDWKQDAPFKGMPPVIYFLPLDPSSQSHIQLQIHQCNWGGSCPYDPITSSLHCQLETKPSRCEPVGDTEYQT
jgi:hypothetical protein